MAIRHRRTAEELYDAFLRQVRHLRRSVALYDEGHHEEAERLASSIYTLLFDGGSNSKSAASLAGAKQMLRFPDSRFPPASEPRSVRIGPPLCVIGTDGYYLPRNHRPEEENYPRIPFSKWWEQTVFVTTRGLQLSRKNIVFAMRNQDGGGHVDDSFKDEAYHWLKAYGDIYIEATDGAQFLLYLDWAAFPEKDNIVCTAFFEGGRPLIATTSDPPTPDAIPLAEAHWASMRQIAWEANVALAEAGY